MMPTNTRTRVRAGLCAGRGRSLFLVTPWVRGDLPPLGGPGNIFVLRDQTIFTGHLKLAVGRYSGRVRAEVAREDGRRIIRSSLGADAEVSPDGLTAQSKASRPATRRSRSAAAADWMVGSRMGRSRVRRRLLAVVKPAIPRPDVAKDFSEGALGSGFKVSAPTLTRYGKGQLSRLRVFAVTEGRATELPVIGSAEAAAAPGQ